MRYVCGFAIQDNRKVALILKERPALLAGYFNGVGGKVQFKKGDVSATVSMVRQFKEETGVDTEVDDWENVGNLFIGNDIIHYFKCNMSESKFNKITTTTDEIVVKFDVNSIMGADFALDKYAKLFLMASMDNRMELMNITLK